MHHPMGRHTSLEELYRTLHPFLKLIAMILKLDMEDLCQFQVEVGTLKGRMLGRVGLDGESISWLLLHISVGPLLVSSLSLSLICGKRADVQH
jgi:hypothetical protein